MDIYDIRIGAKLYFLESPINLIWYNVRVVDVDIEHNMVDFEFEDSREWYFSADSPDHFYETKHDLVDAFEVVFMRIRENLIKLGDYHQFKKLDDLFREFKQEMLMP